MQIANYKRDGGIVAQKLRYPDKKFSFIGDSKACGLFGQHLYEPGRRLVITEGEIDALSVAQALGLRWPVVSVPNGAQGAAKSIKRELEWVNGFDEVVLMFDMDEPGQAAAQEVALLLTPGKAKIAQLPAKDPNELLQRGDAEAITRAIYEAQTKRPDGVVTFGSLKEKALKPVSMGMPWHDPRLTALTYGKRYGEVYTFGAGTGIGKTDWLMEEAAFIAQEPATALACSSWSSSRSRRRSAWQARLLAAASTSPMGAGRRRSWKPRSRFSTRARCSSTTTSARPSGT